MATGRAELDAMRLHLDTQLTAYRKAAGISQPELGETIDKTRSMVSKIEHGQRTMSAEQWKAADDACHTKGCLVAGHTELAQVEQAYRDRCRARRRAAQRAEAQAELETRRAHPGGAGAGVPHTGRTVKSCGIWPPPSPIPSAWRTNSDPPRYWTRCSTSMALCAAYWPKVSAAMCANPYWSWTATWPPPSVAT